MLTVELRFLRGRFHATPWGRNVNEGVPEWPPSPFRLARAVYDAWKRKRPEWSPARVEPVFRALSGRDVVFDLPPARQAHLRLYYRQGTTREADKGKVFDAFVVTGNAVSVRMGFPSATLSPEERNTFDELCQLIGYFGRAESLVAARVIERDGPWNCRPAATSVAERGSEIVRTACLAPPGEHFALEFVNAKAATRQSSPVPAASLEWLDAIGWGTEMMERQKLTQPPALQWVSFRRDAAALSAPTRPRPRLSNTDVNTVVLAVEGKVRPRVIESIRVGEEIRQRAMGAHKCLQGSSAISSRFSGKDETGSPLRGSHLHASYLSWDCDGDGVIDHVIVTAPEGFDRSEVVSLYRLNPLRFPEPSHPSRLIPVAVGMREAVFASLASARYRSATPFIPTHHYRAKRDGDFSMWLRRELERSLENHGLPGVVDFELLPVHELYDRRRVRWIEFRRARKKETPEVGFGFRITLSTSWAGPFSVGRGSHFGLGLFTPDLTPAVRPTGE